MTIKADGTATIQINDGAADGEHWSAQWTTVPTGIEVTLKTLTQKVGDGLGGELSAGMIWDAALQQDPDGTIMHFVRSDQKLSDPDAGFFWCSASGAAGYSNNCGA